MTIGEKITEIRKAAGLSQEEFGAVVGVSRQAVSKWELGQALPDTASVSTIARAFGVSCDELLLDAPPGCAGALKLLTQQKLHRRRALFLFCVGLFGLLWQYFDIRVGTNFYELYWRGVFSADPEFWYQKWLFLLFAFTAAAGMWLYVRAAFFEKQKSA